MGAAHAAARLRTKKCLNKIMTENGNKNYKNMGEDYKNKSSKGHKGVDRDIKFLSISVYILEESLERGYIKIELIIDIWGKDI